MADDTYGELENQLDRLLARHAALVEAANVYLMAMACNGYTGGKMPLACGNAEYNLRKALENE